MKKLVFVLGLALAGWIAYTLWNPRSHPNSAAGADPAAAKPPAALGAAASTGATLAATTPSQASNVSAAAVSSAQKRPWDPQYLQSLYHESSGSPIAFQLVGNKQATGVIRQIERKEGQVVYVAGELTSPEPGRFFFQKQSTPGKAGDFVGVVELPGSKIGYRIEPSGSNGAPELVELPLDQIVCMALPRPEGLEPEPIPPLNPSEFPDYPIPDYQEGIIPLQSLPGAVAVLYIDYRGGYTPTWRTEGIAYERPNVNNAQIREVWKYVAEDFIPFNVNVTTDLKVYQQAPEASRQRCVVTPTPTAAPGAGGVAYIGSWNWTGDTPCWVFMVSGKSCAEAISHEVGHTLQLGHDGQTPDVGYYGGHGSGETGWAPIMGVGYYQPVSQWSKGEYNGANNTEDDLTKIVNNNNDVDYRNDDTGALLVSARYLEIYTNVGLAQGVIERAGDTDAFQFTTTGGLVSLRAIGPGSWGNLAISATLCNGNNVVIASNNPQTTLSAAITTSVGAGTYTFRVTGTGRNNPLSTGFSSYGSIGYYSITGTVANARQPTRFSIPENSPNGTQVGVIPANNPNNDPLVYRILSGNTGNAFGLNNAGSLVVLSSSALNYENLARNTQLPVQFEMFVNITNLVNPALTELNRRVVVAITDVNERPTLSGFNVSVLERVRPGTLIGTLAGDDQDFYNLLSYKIVGGDPDGKFTIGENNGELRVVGELIRSQQAVHSLLIRVSDQVGPVSLMTTSLVSVVVLPNNTPFTPGGINYTIYPNLTGTTMPGLTNAASFPGDPGSERLVTQFEGDTDRGSDFGSVMRGYLIAPVSGNYTFYIATDDDGELWMSTTTNRAGMTRIAYIANGYTAPRVWNKYASQRSAQRTLVAGQAYYIEARQKESGGGDNLAVAWMGPGQPGTNVIPGAFLAPYTMNYRPRLTGFTASLRPDTITGARLGRVELTDINDQAPHTFTILSGNEDGIFAVDNDGWVLLANAAALQASPYSSYALLVRCTDSGALSADTSVFLNVVDANAVVPLSLQREMFYNINGTAVNALLTSSKYPRLIDELVPMNDFIAPVDVAENFGSRVRGYLFAPVTGTYRFFIASDDASQLRMSGSDNPAGAAVIATVSGYTGPNQWNKEAGQMSAPRSLIGGQRYYIEALHKEGGSADHLAVAWLMPGTTETNVIPAGYLEPADLNLAPLFNNQVMGVPSTAPNGTFIGTLAASDSPLDTLAWQIVGGNTGDTFALDPATGRLRVANNTLIADGSVSSFVLTMLVQDSGLGGLYPLRSAQATVTINVLGPNTPLVWTGAAEDGRWMRANNWRGVTPESGARLVFGYPMQQATVNDAVSTLNWVQFTNGGYNVTGTPVTLQAGLTNNGNNTWDLDTTLAGPQAWNNAAGGTLTISGAITNDGHMMNLVTAGDIRLLGPVSGAGGINKTGGARLLMAGTHSYTGPTIVAAAGGTATALEVTGSEDLVLNSDLTLNGRMDLWNRNATVGGLNGTGIIFANDSTRVLTVGANDHSGTFSGVLSNASYSSSAKLALVKAGTGTQHLSGVNRFSGGTVVRAGTLNINNASALGFGDVTLTDAETDTNPVALTLASAVTVNNPIKVAGSGTGSVTLGTANFLAVGLNPQFSGTLTLDRDLILQAGAADRTTFAGWITGLGGIEINSPFAPGRRVIFDRSTGSSNNFAGPVLIGTNAWLQLGNSTIINNRTLPDAAPVSLTSGAQLRLSPGAASDHEMIGALDSEAGFGTVDLVSGGSFVLYVGGGDRSGAFSGNILNSAGALGLGKIGTGRQVLGGANTFAGTVIISGGTLALAHGGALGTATGGTIVQLGGTLALSNNIITSAEAVTCQGAGMGSGALLNEANNNVFNGPLFLAGPTTIGAAAGTLTLAGAWNTAGQTVSFNPAAEAGIIVSQAIAGEGGLIKQGAGGLTLNAAQNFTGDTLIEHGTLVLGPVGAIASSTNISVAAGATLHVAGVNGGWTLDSAQTLRGNGTVAGAALLNGTVAPGSSMGSLQFNNEVTLAGTAVFEISKSGGVLTNDSLRCLGTLTLGGALVLTNSGAEAFVVGDSFKLFDAAAFGATTFASVTLPPLEAGLTWDLSRLKVDGTLRVAGAVVAPEIEVSLSGPGELTLSWANADEYLLQAQTNAPGQGLGPQWHFVPGLTTNRFTAPFDPTKGSVFYRLIRPQ